MKTTTDFNSPKRTFRIDSLRSTSFSLKKVRVRNVSETDKKRKYSYVFDDRKTRSLFREISLSVPKWKGLFVVYGVSNNTLDSNSLTPLELKYSKTGLRSEFKEGKKKLLDDTQIDRYTWMVDLLSSGTYSELRVYTSTQV